MINKYISFKKVGNSDEDYISLEDESQRILEKINYRNL